MPVGLQHGPPPPLESIASAVQRRGRGKRQSPVPSGEGDISATARKDRDPNWNKLKMLTLVRTKRAEFIQELECNDPRVLMNPEMTKWDKISLSMNATLGICCYCSPAACKYKWQTLLPEYKRVADVHKEIGVNSMLYFEMTFGERRTRTLPKNFDPHVYSEMHAWLKHKPTMIPPHFRDLFSPSDGNYIAPRVTEMGQRNSGK
jgi:hypothetical protein